MCMGDVSVEGGGGESWDCGWPDGAKDPGGVARDTRDSPERMARLVRTIEGEIVPRLVLARRVVRVPAAASPGPAKDPDDADVGEFVRLLLAHDVCVASAYVETVRQRGVSLESVCLRLLAPAARELGLLWEEDECDFMQVTVGLCRLHHLLRELSPDFRSDRVEQRTARNILLAPVPGDQHTFGITLVAQFLRKAGWEVWHEYPTNGAEILEIARQNWFAVIGLSVGSETRVDSVASIIRAIRSTSRNRSVGILVGGPVLVARPELAVLVGADATAVDGPMAVVRAEHLCSWQGDKAGEADSDGQFFRVI